MVVWCAQNVRQKRQRFTWHQPCNNQTALSVHHFNGYTNKRTIKCTSHSFRITCDKSAVSLLESREQRSIKVINNNNKQRVRFEVCATQFGHCMKAFLAGCYCCWVFYSKVASQSKLPRSMILTTPQNQCMKSFLTYSCFCLVFCCCYIYSKVSLSSQSKLKTNYNTGHASASLYKVFLH